MSQNPKISIITVVYNGVSTIEDTIQSVLSQDYTNIEYIIVDGASKDGTLDKVERYRKQVAYFVSEPDQGIYDAMNKGLKVATGDIVGILNADDVYTHSGILSLIANAMMENPDIEAVYGNLHFVSHDLKKIHRKWISCSYYENFFNNGEMPPHPTFFVKRSVYNRYGLFNTNFKIAADYELMLRFLKKYQISSYWIDEVLVNMRLGGASTKGLNNLIKQNKEGIKAWKVNELKLPFTYFHRKIIHRIKQFL